MEIRMVEVKKLPPGHALGSTDLQNWASNRLVGRAGSRGNKKEYKASTRIIWCPKCRFRAKIAIELRNDVKFKCRRCGYDKVKLLKGWK